MRSLWPSRCPGNDRHNTRFADIVSALAYTFARRHGNDTQLSGPPNIISDWLLTKWQNAPDYLRFPLKSATLVFDALQLLRGGHTLHSRPAQDRDRLVEKLRRSGLSFERDLLRYFESLATVALYNQPSAPNPASATEPQPYPDHSIIRTPPAGLRCEIAIIGSGPGGATTACLLAEAGHDVLLIEEGSLFAPDSPAPFSLDEMARKYRNGGQTVAFGKNKVAYVEGRCVGGGSEINSGLYHRTPAELLTTWSRQYGVAALSANDMEPHFRSCEQDLSVSLLPGAAPPPSLKLKLGADQLGWKCLEVPRWYKYHGDTDAGSRQTMSRTYIPRFLTAGGKLLPDTRVLRLSSALRRWRLEATHAQLGEIQIDADCTFVCAGAVQTPALLRRSGYTRNIGNSLGLHPTVKVVAEFPEEVNSPGMGVPVHQVKEFSPELSFGCSISSPPYLALGLLDYEDSGKHLKEHWRRMATYYAMVAGETRGSVKALPGFKDALVQYPLSEANNRALANGLSKLSQLLFEAGATTLYPCTRGATPLPNRDYLRHLPQVFANDGANLMTIHLFGSCPMGETASAATDSFGAVHGLRNLYIADASLLPTSPGVNPQGTIMALARRNALHYLKRL